MCVCNCIAVYVNLFYAVFVLAGFNMPYLGCVRAACVQFVMDSRAMRANLHHQVSFWLLLFCVFIYNW